MINRPRQNTYVQCCTANPSILCAQKKSMDPSGSFFLNKARALPIITKGTRNYNLILQGHLDPGTNLIIEQTKAPDT
jgi:hypothetical protein